MHNKVETTPLEQLNGSYFVAIFKDYLELCKPKVVTLMMLTAIVGMILASPVFPSIHVLIWGNLGIALAASSAAAINHLIDSHIDIKMQRTHNRPVATGRITPLQAMLFSLVLGSLGLFILVALINTLTAILTGLTLIGYAGIYTLYLKRATPQNIVIGGAAGAAPPLLGWCAVTNSVTAEALLLVLLIYTWTPPHFWALAIYRFKDYKKANIPMLPVTHGIPFTKLCILLYTFLLFAVSLLPYLIKMCGLIYLTGAVVLGGIFCQKSWQLYKTDDMNLAMRLFHYSITYLNLLFIALLLDHFI